MRFNRFWILFACLATLLSCAKKAETTISEDEQRKQDSLALHVAVYPCQSCMPLYYAEATGMLKALDEDIRLLHLSTMEDCDTALTHHRAEVATSDIARLLCMEKDGFKTTAIAELQSPMQLITAKGKRITAVKQLKERLVAMDRHSYTDYLTDEMLQGTGIDQLDVFRTQFNNHMLRCEMLTNILVDGALLDEPYATLAIAQGGKSIWKSKEKEQGWMVLATTPKTMNDKRIAKQIEVLRQVYDKAAEALNTQPDAAAMDSLLKQRYELPIQAVDTMASLKACQYHKLNKVKMQTIEQAKNWLTTRGWIDASLSTESIAAQATQ